MTQGQGLDTRRLFAVLIVLNVLWTPVNVMVRLATTHGMSPLAVGMFRWGTLCALLVLGLQVPKLRELAKFRQPDVKDRWYALAIGLGLFGPAHVLYYFALTQGASTVGGTVLNATSPVWTAAMAFLILKEKAGSSRIVAIVLGSIGAYLVVVGFGIPKIDGDTKGNLMYLLGTFAECTGGVLSARLVKRSSGIAILTYEIVGNATVFGILSCLSLPALPFKLANPGWQAFGAVGYLVVFAGLICFGMWYILVEKSPLSLMVVTLLLQPPLSALLGWVALGEMPTPQLYAGAGIILVALLLAAFERPSSSTLALGHEMPSE